MLFSSIPFLFYFLPAVISLYFIAPKKLKNAVLFLFSLFFYAWGEPKNVVFMLAAILLGYVCGLLMERAEKPGEKKLWLILSIVGCLGMLGYFKYAGFLVQTVKEVSGWPLNVPQIALPIGISFYTFQILSYDIDVYRKQVPAQRNLLDLATYVALFPQLIAGPIVRYSDVNEQLRNRKLSLDKLSYGVGRFLIGLSKKVLLANQLGEIGNLFLQASEPSVAYYWLYAIAATLHIYFDFSGYSDMAIGLGKVFGFDFPENFNYPYISSSITEFWRRWHISLGSWFRDYVYIPLGGNRVGKLKWFRNILIVWVLTGFWHGAAWNFAIWGLWFAALLVIEKSGFLKVLERHKIVSHIYVLFFVILSFLIFNADSLSQIGQDFAALFGFGQLPLFSREFLYQLRNYAVILLLGGTFSTPYPKLLVKKLREKRIPGEIISWLEPIVYLLLLVLVTAYLVDGSFNPFLYFRF